MRLPEKILQDGKSKSWARGYYDGYWSRPHDLPSAPVRRTDYESGYVIGTSDRSADVKRFIAGRFRGTG